MRACADRLRFSESRAGFETAADSPLVRFIESVTAQPASSIAFGSEASAWSTVAEEVVVFGPGDMRIGAQRPRMRFDG